MDRQTKINLVVVVALLALMLPGGIKLFRKKLAAGDDQAPMLREPVRATIPYAMPTDNPARRVLPAKLHAWVNAELASAGAGSAMLLTGDAERGVPLMSDRRTFQVAALAGGRAYVLVWDAKAAEGRGWRAAVDGADVDLSMTKPLDLPADVHRELRDEGWVTPPRSVMLVALPVAAGARSVRVSFTAGERVIADVADLTAAADR
jgi:hypothetical protein